MDKKDIPEFGPLKIGSYLFGFQNDPRQVLSEDFHIERIEVYKDRLVLPILPHRRSVFYFVYVASGKVIRGKLLNQYEILPGNFFFLAANVTNTIDFVAPETTGFYCQFHPSLFQKIKPQQNLLIDFPFFHLTANPVVKAQENKQLVYLMETLIKEYHGKDKKRFELLPLYLLALLTEVKLTNANLSQDEPINAAAALLTMRYKKALSEFIYEKSKVFEFAEYLSVSPNHLNKAVKSVTGKSAFELLSDMKILEAKVLLTQTSLGIGDIAYKIGKMGQSDFSRFFKSKTTFTPNQYRKNNM